jgi:hypothetical protein
MNRVIFLERLRMVALASEVERREFSLLTGALFGGAIHVGSNAFVKKMLRPGTLAQRVGSAIFQKGVRDRGVGKMIHPVVQRVSDTILGPEISHIYNAGINSTRAARKVVSDLPSNVVGDLGAGVKGVISGRRSPFVQKVLDRLPSAPISRGEKRSDWLGAAAAGAAIGVVDPVLPVMNIARTAISKSSFGRNVLKQSVKKGVEKGASTGVARSLQDYLVSPSLGLAQDLGSTVHGVVPVRPSTKVVGRSST